MKIITCNFIVVFFLPHTLMAATTFFRVESYASKNQSPLAEGIVSGQIRFNNFETPELRTALPGVTLGTAFTYNNSSVDEDDGTLDGFENGGYSLRTQTPNGARPRFIFNFIPDAQGNYPRYFGVAFPVGATDVDGFTRQDFIGASDTFGVAIFTNLLVPMAPDPLTYTPSGSSYWSIFFGFYNESGISQVTFKNAIALDHLQFGYSIPEPHGCWLLALAGIGRRRRYR